MAKNEDPVYHSYDAVVEELFPDVDRDDLPPELECSWEINADDGFSPSDDEIRDHIASLSS